MIRQFRSQDALDNATPDELSFSNDDVADILEWLESASFDITERNILDAMEALILTHIRSEDFFDLCEAVKDMHQKTNAA